MFSIIICTLLISNLPYIQSKNFLGGTISWRPMNNTVGNPMTSVMLTQSYQWNASQTICNQSRVFNLFGTSPVNGTLDCVSNVSLCGGFSPLTTNGYCIDSSSVLNTRFTEISNVENITADSKFCVAFRTTFWRIIRSPLCSFTCYSNSSRGSIGTCLNLTARADGFINTSPVVAITSPIRVPVNSSINIRIPFADADNDIVRCRWARNTSSLDECLDICGVLPGSTLHRDNCTLVFSATGKTVGDYYAVALMVEDFSNTSTNESLSSVPVQFLIQIVNVSSCSLKPIISSNLSNCTAIYVGSQLNFTSTITQGCPNTTIDDFYTVSSLNMFQNNLTRDGSNNTWTITQTWTPTIEQVGVHVYCSVALDSNSAQSDQYCLTFNVVSVGQDLLCPGEVTTTTVTTTVVTAAPARTIIQTVVVPDTSSKDFQFTNFDLALALGISIPLLLTAGALFLCKCCCSQTKCFSSKFSASSQSDGLTKIDNAQTESNQQFPNNNKKKQDLPSQSSPDYRQQYINDRPKFRKDNPVKTVQEKRPLTLEKSLPQKSSSDFDQNSINITKTTFFSPSTLSLTTNKVSAASDHLSTNAKPANQGSVLVRAYCNQENKKTISN